MKEATTLSTGLREVLESPGFLLSDRQLVRAIDVLLTVRYLFLSVSLPVTLCNVVVFLQKSMRSATSVYILGLSFAQIFYLSAHTGQVLWSGLASDPRSSPSFCFYNLYAIGFGSVIARRGSYVILCFVSTERLYAIVRPLQVKQFVLSRFSVAVMVGTFLVTALWHLYLPAKVRVDMDSDKRTGSLTCSSGTTELYARHKDVSDAVSLGVKVVMTYMALVLQIVLNGLTVCALRRHNMTVARASSNEEVRRQRERQLTITILVTTVAYVVLSLPACLDGLLNMVVPDFHEHGRYRNLASVVHNVCLDLQILSCSVDFVCFLALSSSYRKTFMRVFPCFRIASVHRKELDTDLEKTEQVSMDTSG